MPKSSSRFSAMWHGFTVRYVRMSWNHPILLILAIAASVAVALFLAYHLHIRTDLRVLLPKGTPSVIALEESEERKGSTDFYTIAFQSSDPEAVGRLQVALKDSLSKWSEVMWVQYDQDRSFFEDHALLYMPTEDLEDLRDRLYGMVRHKFADANPLLQDLTGEGKEGPNLNGWPNVEHLRRQGLPPDVVSTLISRVQAETGDSAKQSAEAVDTIPAPPRPDNLRDRQMGWHQERGVWVGVVMAQLNQPSTDAIFAKGMAERGEALIARMNVKSYAPDMDCKVVGAFRNFKEVDQVGADAFMAGIISYVLMFLLLLYFLRRLAPTILIFAPLSVAMCWTAAAAYLFFGRMTLLTAFTLSLVLGLGIEYTIHLYGRWAEERRKGASPVDSMALAMQKTARSLISGAATNVFAMLSLQVGHFTGFKEYGVIVSTGIMLALVGSWFVMPPVFFIALRIGGWLQKRLPRQVARLSELILPSDVSASSGVLIPKFRISRRVVNILGLAGLLITTGLVFAPVVGFENDFSNLRGTPNSAGISYGRAVGSGRNTAPGIILGKSEEQMRAVHDSLVKRWGNPADSMMKSFVTIQSFLPSEDQMEERQEVLSEVRDLLASKALQNVDTTTQKRLDVLRKYASPGSFGFTDLPEWAQRFLSERDGSTSKLGYIYAQMRESNAMESAKFQDRFQYLPAGKDSVIVASSGFIYADVIRMVKHDGVFLAFVTLFFLIVITALDMRNWRGVLVVVGFVGLSTLWTFQLMGALGLKIGMFNMVVIPTVLSVSVDSVIHMFHRRMELGAGRIGELLNTTGSSVLAGTLTNLFGYVGLCFVDHKGMQTIGFLATIGIGSGIVVLFTVLPWALEVLCPKEPQGEQEED